jgi:hypothetical protein
MGGECGIKWCREEALRSFCWGDLRDTSNLKNLDIDGRLILK